ncbi:MAG: dihydropteroate synthase [Phycisphaerales bacterium JB040]
MSEDSANTAWGIGPGRTLPLDRPRVMTVLNVTPDSFSDGGRLTSPAVVVGAALRALEDGADLLDVGGESTRPGAERVPVLEQIRRVVPAIEAIRAAGVGLPISVDTTRAEVARAALDAGADIINDVAAGLEDEGVLALAARRGCGLILMHRRLPPGEDSYSDAYASPPSDADVVATVAGFLGDRLGAALAAGVAPEAVVLDPGLGFGKSVEQNLELIAGTPRLLALGRPVLSAASRKSFVGRASLGRDSEPGERLAGSLAVTAAHFQAGARLFRVHDTRPHVEALRLLCGVHRASGAGRPGAGVERHGAGLGC